MACYSCHVGRSGPLCVDIEMTCVLSRNIRRDSMKAVDKLKDASEDEQKALEDAIQELTDEYVKQVDKLVKSKQDELTTV